MFVKYITVPSYYYGKINFGTVSVYFGKLDVNSMYFLDISVMVDRHQDKKRLANLLHRLNVLLYSAPP